MKIGIVIRTFNEEELLGRTIDAILNQNEKVERIVIVDSESTDRTLEIARRYSNIKIIIIRKIDFSYGFALNTGIDAISETVDIAVLLSAHATPCDNNWLCELLTPMRRDANVFGTFGRQLPWLHHERDPIVRVLSRWCFPLVYGDKAFVTNDSYFFSCVNASVRINQWRVNRFDEALDACEDQKWAKGSIEKGGLIGYCPKASVYHSHAESYRRYFHRLFREHRAMREIDPASHPSIGYLQFSQMCRNGIFQFFNNVIRERIEVGLAFDRMRWELIHNYAMFRGRKNDNKR